MKLLKVILLGTIIWALSLFWPQVNQWLSTTVMIAGAVGSGGLILGYILSHYFHRETVTQTPPFQPPCIPRNITDTHPMKPLGMA